MDGQQAQRPQVSSDPAGYFAGLRLRGRKGPGQIQGRETGAISCNCSDPLPPQTCPQCPQPPPLPSPHLLCCRPDRGVLLRRHCAVPRTARLVQPKTFHCSGKSPRQRDSHKTGKSPGLAFAVRTLAGKSSALTGRAVLRAGHAQSVKLRHPALPSGHWVTLHP